MPIWPSVDPIPLPAPVWLFKALLLVTTVLHMLAVLMLTGGLASVLRLGGGRDPARRIAATEILGRLPVVLTFVINLGVPPLLFAQVLYGRALYTSSVLIGTLWISVIPLLMTAGWLVYDASKRARESRPHRLRVGVVLLLVLGIGAIYVINMSFMLQPERFAETYAASPAGAAVPPGDGTRLYRGLFFAALALPVTAAALLALSRYSKVAGEAQAPLRSFAMTLARWGAPLTLALGVLAWRSQPGTVRAEILGGTAGAAAALALSLGALVATVIGWLGSSRAGVWANRGLCGAAVLLVGGLVWLRDAVRDLRLANAGLDVYAREVAPNWSVVITFLVLFVAGLIAFAWLVRVVLRATREEMNDVPLT